MDEPLEGPPALPGVEQPACPTQTTTYRVTSVTLPRNTAEADNSGFNLDQNDQGRPNNAAGSVYLAIQSQAQGQLSQLQTTLDTALDDEDVVWLLEVETCAYDSSDIARIGLRRGADRDGDRRYEAVDTPRVPALGYVTGGTMFAEIGEGSAPVGALFDVFGGHSDAWGDADAFTVEAEIAADGTLAGRLGFAAPTLDTEQIAAPFAALLTHMLVNGPGEYTVDLVTDADLDGDGTVTASEALGSTVFASLFAPDIDLFARHDGADLYWPRYDGVKDHLSFGAWFTAEPVTVE